MIPDAQPDLAVEYDGELAIIRFNRPASRNSLSSALLSALDAALTTITPRTDMKTIIFTGTADVFASGANLKELAEIDSAKARVFSERGQRLFQRIADAHQLTIAAINGYCMGGALDLALSCDVRVASANAIFAHPGAGLGIITGWGGTQRLPRLIGPARASELFFTARRFSASEALQMGLVTALADPILDYARKVGHTIRKR
jgi:enoyl-CoA hydratase